MTADADINLQIKARNARFLKYMRQAGYENPNRFCEDNNITYSEALQLLTFKASPVYSGAPRGRCKDQAGEFRPIALKIAAALGVEPGDIWPEHMRALRVSQAAAEMTVTLDQIAQLQQSDPAKTALQRDAIRKLMSHMLPRQRLALTMSVEGATLDEIGSELGVSVERCRQIMVQGMDRARAAARKLKLSSEDVLNE